MAEADPARTAGPMTLDLARLPEAELERSWLAEHKIVGLNSGDSRSRPFNLMRTSLMNLLGSDETPRLIGITSATPAAGKSYISANLALSLAKVAEGIVLLVDLDLRRGSIATELGLAPTRGVRDFLSGDAALHEIGLRVEGLPLAILPTNAEPLESAELLAGENFSRLLSAIRAQPAKTVVLFDLPPIFANDDAMLSIKHLDGYILVVDSSETRKAHVEDALSMLAPAVCLGTVLNRYRGPIFDKYGYGYGAGAYSKYYDT
jgi:Mrp family chromosome partitioning ATPase|uniref:CpsD/CapB family tyrosine-protein kinase n=1 Tax=Altererythrobacter segetis TaxID=1104773 RepID=UPI001407C712|nr:CpsD/CapB family tyrosine-protein kinase [Altererythrobacter segetis]